jgi:hypothetical protein
VGASKLTAAQGFQLTFEDVPPDARELLAGRFRVGG